MGCLYRLSFPSGKSYIGLTSRDAAIRFKRHVDQTRWGRNMAVNAAIKKYGADAVRCETLVIADDIEYLKEMERRVIDAFGTMAPNGYNLAGGGAGHYWDDETRHRHRAGIKRSWAGRSPDHRRKATEQQVAAMQAALAEPGRELERRRKIKKTMATSPCIPRREARVNAKMNSEKAQAARQMSSCGKSDSEIAFVFDVSRELIRDIRLNKRWA